MANRYINAAVTLPTTSVTDLYTVPTGCSALIQSVIVANESVSATQRVLSDNGCATGMELTARSLPRVS